MLTRRQFIKSATLAGTALSLNHFYARYGLTSPQKNIVIAQGVDLPSLDPYGHSATFNFAMWMHIMEPLLNFDFSRKRYYGILAESWKAEGTEWTFKLRKGVKFHNGMDFTAHDVVFSFERILKSTHQAASLRAIKEMKIIDDHTVKIITQKPLAPFIAFLNTKVIVSHQVYKQFGDDAIKRPVGTGPFKFVEWVRGSHFVAKKNESYWGRPVQLDQVIWKPIIEDAARVTALESGAVDIATNIPPHEADRLEKHPEIRIEKVRALRILLIGLSPRFKPFQNKLVRLAINYAVDVDSLIKHVLDGKAYRITGLAGPDAFGYDPEIKPYPYDPAKAKSLLAQAGYSNGFDIDFYSPSGRYVKDREVAQAIAGQLAKIGVKVNVITPEWSTFWSGVMGGKYPMFLFGGFNYEDPDYFLSLYFQTGITKRIEYSNPEVDKALEEQRQIFDREKREKLLQKTIKMIYDDAPSVFLWHPQDLYGVRKRVKWKPTPDELVLMQDATITG